ncbi:MAG TPA: GntR family transcriptional regulator [Xanthobacteraceae bacterium]|nr:GntR family transcriptional regulator [Xanthobacteraceae bacterium]
MSSKASKTAVDLNRSAVARYIQLAGLFRRRIDAGEWAVDQQIPTVDELAAECGVARATIRQALDILESEQLIERYRAKGTFVRQRRRPQLWCEVATDWSGLLLSREHAVIEVLSDARREQPPDVPHPIGTLAPSYRRLRRRHSRHGAPFLLATLHIDERLSARVSKKDLESKTALRLVSDIPGVKINDARQTLTIGTADVETSKLLDVPLNEPIAIVHRSVVDRSGCLVFIGEGLYRGDMVRIDMKLR